MGVAPIAGWFMSWKIPSFELDDDLGVAPFEESSKNRSRRRLLTGAGNGGMIYIYSYETSHPSNFQSLRLALVSLKQHYW